MRRYGLEFEFAAKDGLTELGKSLRRCHIGVRTRNGGNSNGEAWELKPDGSAVPLSLASVGWRGYELASPILRGKRGLSTLKRYLDRMESLREIGRLRIVPGDGLHVHVEVTDYSWADLARLVRLVLGVEEELYKSLPANRRANGYCRSIQNSPAYRKLGLLIGDSLAGQVEEAVQGLTENRLEDRYFGLNLTDYTRNRTVEFRYADSTFDYSKAFPWLGLMVSLVQLAKTLETDQAPPLREIVEHSKQIGF